jgi:hypothetical protein
MQIKLKKAIREEMEKLFPDNPVYEVDEDEYHWRNDKTIDTKFLSTEELTALLAIYERPENTEDIKDRREARKLKALLKLVTGKAKRIVNLNSMTEALKMELAKLKRHWVFVEDQTAEAMVPYLVTNIKFVPTQQFSPAHIELGGLAMYRGGRRKLSRNISREDLGEKGCTAGALLETLGLFPETDELIAAHEEQVAQYRKIRNETGLQLIGHGDCEIKQDRYSTVTVSLDKGGIVSKLVVDDEEDFGKESEVTSCNLWSVKHGKDGEDAEVFKLPVQPYLRVFSLKMHEFLHIHVRNTDIYIYEEGLEDKLVLSNDKRELIDLLVSSGGDDSRDIVQGKSGGVIIITSGPPGTGKTLTSEVFSEKVQRPLYVVQCSQLGVTPETLEKKLDVVLDRAVRWNAVLLIDEADVGVFLRLLEYYSGVLFLTTNRECVIDDAIMSRAIAHVRYVMPRLDERVQLWSILSAQYDVPFDEAMCEKLSLLFPGLSGRSIKQLIRLSKALSASRGQELTAETIEWVSRFQHLETLDTPEEKEEAGDFTTVIKVGAE